MTDDGIIYVAKKVFDMGYVPVPLNPGEKRPTIWNWQNIAAGKAQDYNNKPLSPFSLWSRAAPDANLGIYCGELVIIVDGDAKDEDNLGVTGKEVMDYLWEHHPILFKGCIMELTAGGGSHTTYKWEEKVVKFPRENTLGKTYCLFTRNEVPIIPEYRLIKIEPTQSFHPLPYFVPCEVLIELLTRNAQSVAPPSVVKGREYRYHSRETHLTTRQEMLPGLPAVFREANARYVKVEKDEEAYKKLQAELYRLSHANNQQGGFNDNLESDDMDAVAEGLLESFLVRAIKTKRHFNALGLAQHLAGHGIDGVLMSSTIEDYFRRCGREANPGEIDGIIKRAYERPDTRKVTPWKTVWRRRRERNEKRKAKNADKVQPSQTKLAENDTTATDKMEGINEAAEQSIDPSALAGAIKNTDTNKLPASSTAAEDKLLRGDNP